MEPSQKERKWFLKSLQCKQRVSISASLLLHSESGLTKATSILKSLLEESECSIEATLKNCLATLEAQLIQRIHHKLQTPELPNNEPTSFIVEYPPLDKKMILEDRLNVSENASLTIVSSKILALALTSTAKACKPFWNSRCKDVSEMLWLPTKTDLHALGSNSYNTSLNFPEDESLFWMTRHINPESKNLQRTSCLLSTCLTADQPKNENTLSARKYRFYPTNEQRRLLRKWIHGHRFTYNQFLEYTKNHDVKEVKWTNFYKMRELFVTHKVGSKNKETIINPFFHDKEWLLETPKSVRADAIKTLVSAYKTCFSNKRNGNINRWDMRFRSRKQKTYTFSLDYHADIRKTAGNIHIFPRIMKEHLIFKKRTKKELKDITINHDAKIHYDGRQWFLIVVSDRPVNNQEEKPQKKTMAFDPGVRTFQTGYSETETIEISSREDLLEKLQDKLDKLKSIRKFRSLYKIRKRQKDVVNDLHWRTISYLKKNQYTDVLLPTFESQEMVKHNRTLSSKTKRCFLRLRHYVFKQRLKTTPGLNVRTVDEAFTTKTCGRCGTLNHNIGGSVVFQCPSETCGAVIHRDINAARNIYIKYYDM